MQSIVVISNKQTNKLATRPKYYTKGRLPMLKIAIVNTESF